MLNVTQLFNNDINHYLNALTERIKWLDQNNLSMWKTENATKEKLIELYKAPLFFGGFENEECIGGFILIETDPLFWPNNLLDKAFYFHKLVVNPKYSRQGYSSKLLEWIKEYGKSHKKEYIRLDYDKNRQYLRNMYLSHGFDDINEINNPDGKITILGEYKYK